MKRSRLAAWLLARLREPLLASALAALLLFAACLGLLRPRYAINDDLKLITILAGYPGGGAAPFLIFSNVLLGLLLVPLYGLHTPWNWEILLFLLTDLLSTWALLYTLFSWPVSGRLKALGGAVIAACCSYFALNPTFTNAAGLACFAGLCLLLAATRGPAVRRAAALGGMLLVFAGSLIRIEMAALTVPLVLAGAVFIVRRGQLRPLVVFGALTAALVIGGYAFDRLYVRLHPDWNAYYFYNKTAQQLQDAHRLQNTGLLIRRISWSKNDQELFARSFFPNADIYSVERIQYLLDRVPQTAANPAAEARIFLERLIAPSGMPFTVLIAALWLAGLAARPSPRKALALTAVVAASLTVNLFLAWYYKNPDWSLFTLLANTAAWLMLLWAWPDAGGGARQRPLGPLAILTLVPVLAGVALMVNRAVIVSNEGLQRRAAYEQLLRDLDRLQAEGRLAPDAVIVSPSHGIPWEWSNPLVLDLPRIPFLDTGYITFSPFYEAALDRYGLRPLPQALYEKPNVYVMTKRVFQPFLKQYYAEHGGISVSFEPIYDLPSALNVPEYTDTQLYKVVRVK